MQARSGFDSCHVPTPTVVHLHEPSRPLRVLVASTECSGLGVGVVQNVIPGLASLSSVSLKAILEPSSCEGVLLSGFTSVFPNVDLESLRSSSALADLAQAQATAAELSEWADVLCLTTVDAQTIAKLLHGLSSNLLLEVVRSWDVSKKILLVPAMSSLMWENPMSKKQLRKLRKWNWVRVLAPVLWTFEHQSRKVLTWDVIGDVIDTIRNQVDMLSIEQDYPLVRPCGRFLQSRPTQASLPPEIWTAIFDHVGDWELAQALHIYTTLPRPRDWCRPSVLDESQELMKRLEWSILTGTLTQTKSLLSTHPAPKWLSYLCVKLIIKFSKLSLLAYLECNHHNLFWEAFGHKRIPILASTTFGRTDVLEWWRTSPSFLTKEYTPECLDGASRAGFVHVLEWWRLSGLPMRYTETALEQASAKGDLEVLDWWKRAGEDQTPDGSEIDTSEPYLQSLAQTTLLQAASMKVGKSVIFAAQHNQIAALRWWDNSGIPYAHEDQVAKIASACGYIQVLQLWKELKGEKMIYDNQVLVVATKGGHAIVLDWWKYSGFRVEYKTCDIEEALEDSVSGEAQNQVRKWWARNGLNLGVSTTEWSKAKVLG